MVQRADPGIALGMLRFVVQESVAGTLAEVAIQTPTSPASNIAMRIWRISWELEPPVQDTFPAADNIVLAVSRGSVHTRQDLAAIQGWDGQGAILAAQAYGMAGSVPADAGGGLAMDAGPKMMDYGPFGLLIPTQEISVYAQGSNAVNTIAFRGVIYYTLDRITSAELIAALSAVTTL